mgnify:CR=1 FL=1
MIGVVGAGLEVDNGLGAGLGAGVGTLAGAGVGTGAGAGGVGRSAGAAGVRLTTDLGAPVDVEGVTVDVLSTGVRAS